MNQQSGDLFLRQVGNIFDVPSLRGLADAVAEVANPDVGRDLMAACNRVSPFFIAHAKADQPPAMSQLSWMQAVTRARVAAANSVTPRIIVSAPMKSGSTFLSDSLERALSLPKISMLMLLAQPYGYVPLGAGNRPHEIDEMALISACLNGAGFVSHHHMICTPFLARQAEVYSLKFVLMKRNIFDCIISLDDHSMKVISSMGGEPDAAYLRTQLPPDFVSMNQDERIHRLLNRFLHIYVQYHVSWKYFERKGLIRPFWISYENDLLADKPGIAARLAEWLGRPEDAEKLLEKFSRERESEDVSFSQQVNFNKGVSGRGAAIKGENRRRVVEAFEDFKDLADWSEILG